MSLGHTITSTQTGLGSGFKAHVLGVQLMASVKIDTNYHAAQALAYLSTNVSMKDHQIEILYWQRS